MNNNKIGQIRTPIEYQIWYRVEGKIWHKVENQIFDNINYQLINDLCNKIHVQVWTQIKP